MTEKSIWERAIPVAGRILCIAHRAVLCSPILVFLPISNFSAEQSETRLVLDSKIRTDSRPLALLPSGAVSPSAAFESEGSVIFVNRNARARIELPGTLVRLDAGRDSRHVSALTLLEGGKDESRLRATVVDVDGRLVTGSQLPWARDEPFPELAVDPEKGTLVAGFPTTGEIRFHDQAGRLSNSLLLFGQRPHSLEKSLLIQSGLPGGRIAIAAMPAALSPPAGQGPIAAALFLFDSDGTLLWKRELPLPGVYALAVTKDGLIAVSCFDRPDAVEFQCRTLLYDDAGLLRTEFLHLFRGTRLSADGSERVFFEKDSLWVYDVATGQLRERAGMAELVLDARKAVDRDWQFLVAKSAYRAGSFMYESVRIATAGVRPGAANATLPPDLSVLDARFDARGKIVVTGMESIEVWSPR